MTTSNSEWSDFQARTKEVKALSSNLDTWQQCDLVARLPLSWAVTPNPDPVTGLSSGTADVGFHHELVTARLAILCSQTCDVAGEAIGKQHPFVFLAPLITARSIDNPDRLTAAREQRVGYLFPVAVSTDFAEGEEWFADFRFLTPVSKGMLAGATRIPNVMAEGMTQKFAEALAMKFRRPALSGLLSDDLRKSLEEMVQAKDDPSFRKIEQVRIAMDEGSNLVPTAIHLLVFENELGALSGEDRKIWREWEVANRADFAVKGLNLGATLFVCSNVITAAIYRMTFPIRVQGITTINYW